MRKINKRKRRRGGGGRKGAGCRDCDLQREGNTLKNQEALRVGEEKTAGKSEGRLSRFPRPPARPPHGDSPRPGGAARPSTVPEPGPPSRGPPQPRPPARPPARLRFLFSEHTPYKERPGLAHPARRPAREAEACGPPPEHARGTGSGPQAAPPAPGRPAPQPPRRLPSPHPTAAPPGPPSSFWRQTVALAAAAAAATWLPPRRAVFRAARPRQGRGPPPRPPRTRPAAPPPPDSGHCAHAREAPPPPPPPPHPQPRPPPRTRPPRSSASPSRAQAWDPPCACAPPPKPDCYGSFFSPALLLPSSYPGMTIWTPLATSTFWAHDFVPNRSWTLPAKLWKSCTN